MRAVLKAHGIKPGYTKTMNMDAPSRAAFKEIGLHFPDLRREAGSRWLDDGVPLHTIRDWLGHTNISQTSTYLSGTARTQFDAMTAYERRLQPIATDVGTGAKRGHGRLRGVTESPKPRSAAKRPSCS
jgi:integrase